jgi:hypothetical protein
MRIKNYEEIWENKITTILKGGVLGTWAGMFGGTLTATPNWRDIFATMICVYPIVAVAIGSIIAVLRFVVKGTVGRVNARMFILTCSDMAALRFSTAHTFFSARIVL